jgi:hypothetical protein
VNWKNRVDPWPRLPTAIRDCRDGGREATGRLVALLAAIETTEDENSGLMALRLLAETPKTVLRLDEPIRRGRWSSPNYPSTIDKIGERAKAGFRVPIAVAADIEELLSVADKDPDILPRSRTAEAAARETVGTKRTKTLRQQANSKYPEVRALAVTGPVRIGLDEEVVSCLNDKSSLVRAHARDAPASIPCVITVRRSPRRRRLTARLPGSPK